MPGPPVAIAYDRAVRLSALVRRITQRNPGPFTGPGTNTHLVGTSELFVLDPGEDRGDDHLDRIVAAVGDATVQAVIPSHGHPDHWPLAEPLAKAVGAPIWFFGQHEGFRADRSLMDNESLEVEGVRLRVIHTPGHSRDHISFLLVQEQALFPGDHVMGWSTSIIAPPDGDLIEYMDSLKRLAALPDLRVLYPAHGEAIPTPYVRMSELRLHREARSQQVLAALDRGPSRLAALVAGVYADVDPALHAAAAQSLWAHLLALETAGTVVRVPGSDTGPRETILWRRG